MTIKTSFYRNSYQRLTTLNSSQYHDVWSGKTDVTMETFFPVINYVLDDIPLPDDMSRFKKLYVYISYDYDHFRYLWGGKDLATDINNRMNRSWCDAKNKEFVLTLDTLTYDFNNYLRFPDVRFALTSIYGEMKLRYYFTFIPSEKRLRISLNIQTIQDHHTPNVFEWITPFFECDLRTYVSVSVECQDEYQPIIPINIEDPNSEKRQFFINYLLQIWFNKLTDDEETQFIVDEEKKYLFEDMITTINKLSNNVFSLTDDEIQDQSGTNIDVKVIKNLPIWNIKINNQSYSEPSNFNYYDKFFQQFDGYSQENNKFITMYKYILIKGTGNIVFNNKVIDLDKIGNVWLLIPILSINHNFANGWGKKNNYSTLGTLTQILSENAITSTFITPISPIIFGFYSRNILYELAGYLDTNNNGWPEDIQKFRGLYNLFIENNDTPIACILVNDQVVKIWLENNSFFNKTKKYLDDINLNPLKFPTKWENEPILYSPQLLICYIKSITNNYTPIANDLFDLKYVYLFLSIKSSCLQTNMISFHTNFFNPQKILSMSKNELVSTISGEIPFKTSAFINWLNQNQLTQDTSYKIYNYNQAQRKDNYNTQTYITQLDTAKQYFGIFGDMWNMIGGAISSIATKNPSGLFESTGQGFMNVFNRNTQIAINEKKIINQRNQMETLNKIDKIKLDSQFNNIKLSSGKDTILPSFLSGAFARDSSLVIYTLKCKDEYAKKICLDRLKYGVAINEILKYNQYDNRKIFNVIAIDNTFNYEQLFNILKRNLISTTILNKFNNEYIKYFINNYLSGITIFKDIDDYNDEYWLNENNYENDIMIDENNLNDE